MELIRIAEFPEELILNRSVRRIFELAWKMEHFTDQNKRRDFDMLFDSFEAYDVQETRRISKEEGSTLRLITQVCKKYKNRFP